MSEIDETRAPLMEHLIELRRRLIWSFLALGVAFAVSFYFAGQIFGFLVQPLIEGFGGPGEGRLVYTKLYEAFFTEVRVALFAAFFLAFPIIAIQLWAFVAPGLYAKEKRAFLPFLIATPVLFVGGGALAYYVVMPLAIRFFLGYQGQIPGIQQEALPAMGEYLSFVMHFILAFGISFLLPILLILLERAGLVTRDQLKSGRRYAILVAFVIAAVATPPDIISQFMLAIPLILLYELSLVAIWFTERKRAKEKALAPPA
ncbi:MAG TPA: twin-arginine translocase subunit TatC [Allosphingosinicella sp.]|nr:twin-arginine translocase subunit TatC [Allosphingosinicella sp.]